MIQIGINSDILVDIISGRKTIEGRLAKGKFLTVKPGDIMSIREDFYVDGIIARSKEDAAMVQVESIQKYPSFREMLHDVGFEVVIPSATNLNGAAKEYALYYSSEDEAQYGVLGISFTTI